MKQNAKAFETQGLKIAKAYLDKSMDAKSATRLKTILDEAGVPKITDHKFIKATLKVLEQMLVDAKPVWFK